MGNLQSQLDTALAVMKRQELEDLKQLQNNTTAIRDLEKQKDILVTTYADIERKFKDSNFEVQRLETLLQREVNRCAALHDRIHVLELERKNLLQSLSEIPDSKVD